MKFLANNYTDRDLSVIRWQIKNDKVSLGGIVERCSHDFPRIILLDPKEKNGNGKLNFEALSNVIWLTCPYLNEKIHKLETDGYVSKIYDFIKKDRTFTMKMENAHANFYFLRKTVYAKFTGVSDQEEWFDVFNTGIGGIKNLESLKCLHMHFSHYRICDNNIAGKIAYLMLEKVINCEEVLCDNALPRI